jgi:hypothetical protein
LYENQYKDNKVSIEENDDIQEIQEIHEIQDYNPSSQYINNELTQSQAMKNYVNYRLKPTKHNLEKQILKSRLIRYNDENDHSLHETYDVIKINCRKTTPMNIRPEKVSLL